MTFTSTYDIHMLNAIQLYWMSLIILKLMKKKKDGNIGTGGCTKGKKTDMRNSKREEMRRKDGPMEEFNEISRIHRDTKAIMVS